MKHYLRHLYIIAATLSSLTLIAQDIESQECLVKTFSPDNRFETRFTALFLKPSATNTHFAAEAFPLPVISPNWQIHDICKKYHFSFDLLFRAQLHNAHTSAFLNWQHFTGCDKTAFTTDSNNMVGPFFEIGPDASPYFTAAGKSNFKFDEVNTGYEQNIQFGQRLRTNVFAAISFVRICELLTFEYEGTQSSENVSRTILTPTKFKGVGPQFGTNITYDIACGLELAAKLSTSLLTGTSYNHTTYTSKSPLIVDAGGQDPNIQTTKVNCISLLVPVLFTKLGLGYEYEFCDHYIFNIEAGYQAQIYFNALQTIDMGSEVVTPPVASSSIGVYARTFQRNMSNFALTGPYVSIDLRF